MNISEKSGDGDILEIATWHLRDSPAIAGPSAELIDRTVAAMRQSPQHKRPWTTISLMAASVLLAIGVAGWLLFRGSGEIAFADVMRQVMQTKSFQARIIQEANGHEPPKSARLSVKGSHGRFDTDDGLIIIADSDSGYSITLDTKAHLACRAFGPLVGNCDIYAELREIASQVPKSIGKKEFNGRMLNGFSGTVTFVKEHAFATVWVDPQTKLPARIELSQKPDRQPESVIDDLKFDVPLDDSLFDMSVPKGYELRSSLLIRAASVRSTTITGRGSTASTMPTIEIPLPNTPAPAPTAQELQNLVLKPGIGIGELKLGDKKEQIEAVLGQPQGAMREGPAELLEYSGKGLILVVNAKSGLQMIMAQGPSTSSKSRMRPFAGTTDILVRIGSTLSEIEMAYGKDYTVVEMRVENHPEVHDIQLLYQQLGLMAIINKQTNRCDELIVVPPPFVAGPSTQPSP
jgi:hypothetical protein